MCGVFGVYAPDRDVARLTYFGLFALQHRGQESAGIAVSEHGRLTGLRDLGLVSQVFDEQKLGGLRGQVAIGHNRYSTTGSSQWANAQPLVQHGRARTVALGHNGNLINVTELRDELREAGVPLGTTSDSELIAALIANDPSPLEEAVANAMRRLEGAYSIVALSEGRLIAFRDAHGFRPLVIGRIQEDLVFASETCALDLVGAEFVREVAPGELVVADAEGLHATQALERPDGGALCIWEFFYLARPDSRLEGMEVHNARVRMGERLAQEAPVEADLVLPIPDSGTPAAIGFARALGLPFSEGLIKNRYVQRTFIQPDQELRRQGIKLKYHPVAEVAGKRVVAVDDSIVRGNTTREIVRMLFDAGAAEVHLRVSSPPVIGQCFYGIDLADPSEMIASTRSVEEIREHLGATSLAYLSHDGLVEATRRPVIGPLPRLPHRRLSDRGARGGGKAQVRTCTCLTSCWRRPERTRTSSGLVVHGSRGRGLHVHEGSDWDVVVVVRERTGRYDSAGARRRAGGLRGDEPRGPAEVDAAGVHVDDARPRQDGSGGGRSWRRSPGSIRPRRRSRSTDTSTPTTARRRTRASASSSRRSSTRRSRSRTTSSSSSPAHGRVRPYNKWLEWELREHPLPAAVDLSRLERIARTGDLADQQALFRETEALARELGHGATIDGWEPDVAFLRGH